MPAAYQTGTAADQTALLQALVTWLTAQGWTNNMSQADGSGWRAHLSKGGLFINLRAYFNADTNSNIWVTTFTPNTQKAGIAIYAGTGFNSGNSWRTQAGGPIRTGTSDIIGANLTIPSNTITAYHFFDDGNDNINVVIEKSAGVFGSMGWGNLVKAGAFTGGAFFYGQSCGVFIGDTTAGLGYGWNLNGAPPCTYGNRFFVATQTLSAASFFRADIDTFTGKWIGCGSGTDPQGGTGWSGYSELTAQNPISTPNMPYYDNLMARSSSVGNGRGILLPANYYADRSAGGVSMIGRVPTVFYTIKQYPAASIVSIAGLNYMAFPANYGGTPTACTFLIPKLA